MASADNSQHDAFDGLPGRIGMKLTVVDEATRKCLVGLNVGVLVAHDHSDDNVLDFLVDVLVTLCRASSRWSSAFYTFQASARRGWRDVIGRLQQGPAVRWTQ